jgi:hypothetical protein
MPQETMRLVRDLRGQRHGRGTQYPNDRAESVSLALQSEPRPEAPTERLCSVNEANTQLQYGIISDLRVPLRWDQEEAYSDDNNAD